MSRQKDTLEWLKTRRSVPLLGDPAPSLIELDDCITAAMAAPDHHRLQPWRIRIYAGEARDLLANAFTHAAQHTMDEAERLRVAQHPYRAPVVALITLYEQPHPKVPEFEQWLSVGAFTQNFLLALHAYGYAAIWRTGAMAMSTLVHQQLALEANEKIAGFVYIGTAQKEMPSRDAATIDAIRYVL